MRVCLISNEPEHLLAALAQAGHEADDCLGTDVALAVAEKHGSEVVIFHAAVPETGGVTRRAALKALAGRYRIILLAEKTSELVPYAAALGVRDFVFTPAAPAAVLHRLEHPATGEEAAEALAGVTVPEPEPETGRLTLPRVRIPKFEKSKFTLTPAAVVIGRGDLLREAADRLAETLAWHGDVTVYDAARVLGENYCHIFLNSDSAAQAVQCDELPQDPVPPWLAVLPPGAAPPEGVPVFAAGCVVPGAIPVARDGEQAAELARQTGRPVLPLSGLEDALRAMLQGRKPPGLVRPGKARKTRTSHQTVNKAKTGDPAEPLRRLAGVFRRAAAFTGAAAVLFQAVHLGFWAAALAVSLAALIWAAGQAAALAGIKADWLAAAADYIAHLARSVWAAVAR